MSGHGMRGFHETRVHYGERGSGTAGHVFDRCIGGEVQIASGIASYRHLPVVFRVLRVRLELL